MRGFDLSSLLETIFNTSPMAIVIVDGDHRIHMANETTVSVFGYSSQEMQGQDVNILVPTELRDSHTGKMENYISSPNSRPMGRGRDLVALKKNGDCFPAEIGLNPIEHDGSKYVVVSILDITRRKQVEADNLKKIEALFEKTERL